MMIARHKLPAMASSTAQRDDFQLLALDTSTERLAIGVQARGRSWTLNAPGGALASSTLLPQVASLLAQAGLSYRELDFIAFGRGPGAFTGLRTACAVAQGLALGLGLPVLAIDSLLIVAEDARMQAAADHAAFEIGVAMDARMNEVYAGRYRWQAGRWLAVQAPALHSLAAWAEAWAEEWAEDGAEAPLAIVAGSALDAFGAQPWLPANALRVAREHDRAAALLRLAVLAAQQGEGVDAALALPLYLRDKVALTTRERTAVPAG